MNSSTDLNLIQRVQEEVKMGVVSPECEQLVYVYK